MEPGLGAFGSAEALALVADDGLDGGEQLGRGHESDGDAGAAEDGLDDFAVVEVGNDDAVFYGVAADDAAGGNFEIEDGIAGGRELMDELFGGRAAIEDALVAVFEDDDATALDARVVRLLTAAVTKLAKAMLVMKRPRLSTWSMGSSPCFHSAMRTLPLSMPVSTPT